MYPAYIIKNQEFLEKISRTKSRTKFEKILHNADDDQLLAIVEICYNILKGRLRLSDKSRFKLSNHGDYFRSVSKSRTPNTARKRIQEGGGVGVLGAIIAPILGALAQNLLDKALTKNEAR